MPISKYLNQKFHCIAFMGLYNFFDLFILKIKARIHECIETTTFMVFH